uniref:NADH dehydrogenase [ubiquinone] 1 alpha subcomplex assembly factor 4 n=1 Tax=Myxine glutinosa TaxID=7769 RepID=UPI00358F7328
MGSSPTRMLRNYNIEERAMKVISKDKPVMAPRHPIQVHQASDYPKLEVEMKTKNESLLKNLENIKITETIEPSLPISNEDRFSARVLNQQRRMSKTNFTFKELGFVDVLTVPSGRISIVEVVTLLGKAKSDPSTWTPQHVAEEYSISEEQARMLLENFSTFEVVFTADAKERSTEGKHPEMINTPS